MRILPLILSIYKFSCWRRGVEACRVKERLEMVEIHTRTRAITCTSAATKPPPDSKLEDINA